MEYVGPASDWDEIWWRGRPEERSFTAFYVKDGRLAAALTVGRSDDLTVAARLLADKTDISGMRARIENAASEIADLG
jgi:3-phenylpropionate/trans-cinnamate dioxygenase ferredoxin reductase subunit